VRGFGAAAGAEITTWPNKSRRRGDARRPEADVVWRTFIYNGKMNEIGGSLKGMEERELLLVVKRRSVSRQSR
jgi:hypothetical protein